MNGFSHARSTRAVHTLRQKWFGRWQRENTHYWTCHRWYLPWLDGQKVFCNRWKVLTGGRDPGLWQSVAWGVDCSTMDTWRWLPVVRMLVIFCRERFLHCRASIIARHTVGLASGLFLTMTETANSCCHHLTECLLLFFFFLHLLN